MFSAIKNFLFSNSDELSMNQSELKTIVKKDLSFIRNPKFIRFAKSYVSRDSSKTDIYNRLLLNSSLVHRICSSENGIDLYSYVVQLALPYPPRDVNIYGEFEDNDEYTDEDGGVAYFLKTYSLEEFGGLLSDFILKYEVEPMLGLDEDFISFAVFLFTRNQSVITSNTPTQSNSYFSWMSSSDESASMKKLYSKFYDRHFVCDNKSCVSIEALQEIINHCNIVDTPPYFSQLYNTLRTSH